MCAVAVARQRRDSRKAGLRTMRQSARRHDRRRAQARRFRYTHGNRTTIT